MKIRMGDLWDFADQGIIGIPVNKTYNAEGLAVMGKGVALQAAERFPDLRKVYGDFLQRWPEARYPVFMSATRSFVCIPVKEHWREKASLDLISGSLRMLVGMLADDKRVFLPLLGCGFGELRPNDVLPIMEALDDRFTLVMRDAEVHKKYPVSFRDGVRVDRSLIASLRHLPDRQP